MNDDTQERKPPEGTPSEEPHIYAVKKRTGKNGLSRREFLEISTVSAVAATLAGCGLSSETSDLVSGGEVRPTITRRVTSTAEATRTPRPTDTRQPTVTQTPTRTPTRTNSPTTTAITFLATVRNDDTNVRAGPSTE